MSQRPVNRLILPLLAALVLGAANEARSGGAVLWRINCGGPDWDSPRWVSTDRDNHPYGNADQKFRWMADTFFTGGGSYTQRNNIASSEADTLFQTERWNPDGADGVKYEIPVPNGDIWVGLYFAEISPEMAGAGKRVFDVYINDEKRFENFDIWNLVGSNKAYHEEKLVKVTDGKVRIRFENLVHHAKISAIEIIRAPLPYTTTAPYRIDCGAENDWYDKDDNGWQADAHWYAGSLAASTIPIQGTLSPELYASERWFNPKEGQMMYEFDLLPGNYNVRLHFAEPWESLKASGKRVFKVKFNGKVVLDHLDIFDEVGFANALVKEVAHTAVGADAKLEISFENIVHEAKIDAIEILPVKPVSLGSPGKASRKLKAVFKKKNRDALGRTGRPIAPAILRP